MELLLKLQHHDMNPGVYSVLVSETMSSWGNYKSVCMLAANAYTMAYVGRGVLSGLRSCLPPNGEPRRLERQFRVPCKDGL